MPHFTLKDLVSFTQNENKMVEEIFPETIASNEPSESSIQNILAFSKAYSVRRTEKGMVRMVLN